LVVTTPEQHDALDVARDLARLGVPLFLARPDPTRHTGFALPSAWQRARPDPTVPDHWRPGMALCAVTGHVLDLIDLDPRSGGDLPTATAPSPYAVAYTPSGGRHLWVAPLGVESRDGAWPGVDVKSGTPEGLGRGFGFIAPTERVSKVDGVVRAYRWKGHVLDSLPSAVPDTTGWEVRQRVLDLRAASVRADDAPRRLPRSVAAREWGRAYRHLVDDLRHWAAHGWGGQAHAGLLAHTTHLARLNPDHAEAAYAAAFAAAGLDPDEADLAKMDSALARVVPDEVVDDAEMDPQELFWAGGDAGSYADPHNLEDERDAATLRAAGWDEADVRRFAQAGRRRARG
jgi:hypothetical protein